MSHDLAPDAPLEQVEWRVPDRIASKIEMRGPDDCWLWTAAIKDTGYGAVWWDDRTQRAHRVVYELVVGPIPDGLHLDHLCRVRHCVNPRHLEPVTKRVNTLRGEAPAARWAARTHCKRGHALTGDNVGRSHGYRRCRACHRDDERARRAARSAS